MNKKQLIALLLAAMMLLATACTPPAEKPATEAGQTPATDSGAATDEGATDAPAGAYRDTINVALTAQPPTLDSPTTASQIALDISQNFYETLYTQNENFEPTPMLAKSHSVNDDFTVYTFELRDDVVFHNGQPMTAEDVVASMNYWLQKSSRAKNLLGEAEFVVTGDFTVECRLPNPSRDLLALMSAQANMPAIRTKEAIESAGDTGVTDYNGTGPYKFVEWTQDQHITLEKNENYKPLDTPASGFSGKREALTDKIVYHFVPDASTRINGMLTGLYDVTEDVPTENYEELSQNPDFQVFTEVGGTLTLFFNVTEGVLSNVDMRKAIVTGLNNEEIMIGSFVNPDLFTMDPGYMNMNNPQWASKAGEENYNVADPEKAKELLQAAGYNGETVRLLTTPDYNEMYSATLVVQEQLRQMGINAEVESYDFPTFMEHRQDLSSWDIFITSNGYQITPQQLLILDPSWAGADNPELKDMITEMRNAETQDEARAKWDAIQAYLYNDYLSSIALGQFNEVGLINKKVEGFVYWQAPILWNTRVAE